jgi:hypothetical protein
LLDFSPKPYNSAFNLDDSNCACGFNDDTLVKTIQTPPLIKSESPYDSLCSDNADVEQHHTDELIGKNHEHNDSYVSSCNDETLVNSHDEASNNAIFSTSINATPHTGKTTSTTCPIDYDIIPDDNAHAAQSEPVKVVITPHIVEPIPDKNINTPNFNGAVEKSVKRKAPKPPTIPFQIRTRNMRKDDAI